MEREVTITINTSLCLDIDELSFQPTPEQIEIGIEEVKNVLQKEVQHLISNFRSGYFYLNNDIVTITQAQ
jgi:hypothetical protein